MLVTAQEKAAHQKRVEVLRELDQGNRKGNRNKIKIKPGNQKIPQDLTKSQAMVNLKWKWKANAVRWKRVKEKLEKVGVVQEGEKIVGLGLECPGMGVVVGNLI